MKIFKHIFILFLNNSQNFYRAKSIDIKYRYDIMFQYQQAFIYYLKRLKQPINLDGKLKSFRLFIFVLKNKFCINSIQLIIIILNIKQ